MNRPDLVHLTFTPPDRPGSYNRLVGAQMKHLADFSQAVISYSRSSSNGAAHDERVVLVNERGLSVTQHLALRVPGPVRRNWFNGIRSREYLTYAWQIAKTLPRLRPRLIICYDDYNLGPLLRRMVDWPCRFVFSQHGLSYYLPVPDSIRLYNLRSFDAICVLTRASYRADRQRIPAYEPMVSVIPNGIDVDRFHPPTPEEKSALRQQWKLPADKRIVLILARLVPKKGAHVVLQSWAQIVASVPDAFLWIVGGGKDDYMTYLKGLVASQPGLAASVRFEGAVAPEAVHECYRASDVYVFPTLFCEGMGLSLVEAMATGLPCVVSEYEIGRELLSDQEVLFVPDPNVDDAFVAPLIRLLSDASVAEEMGRRGRAAVQARFGQELWLDRLRALYRRQLSFVANGS